MKKIIFLFLLILPWPVMAGTRINEVAWMGSDSSASDEWIELYNDSDEDLVLDGYTLAAGDGSPCIDLTGSISANAYFLLERTDDDSVPLIAADLVYSGSLENGGEHLRLMDDAGDLLDEIAVSDGWPGGDNELKLTMERTASGTWYTSSVPGGTPRAANSKYIPGEDGPGLDSPESGGSASLGRIPTDVCDYEVIISEILPNPRGSDVSGQLEFFELYNYGDLALDLSGWSLGDGSRFRYAFTGGILKPGHYLVFDRMRTGLALNNSGDTLSLYCPDRKTAKQKVHYDRAEEAHSYNINIRDCRYTDRSRCPWAWSPLLSPGQENEFPVINEEPVLEIEIPDEWPVGRPLRLYSADTTDPEGDELSFEWDFGDGYMSFFPEPEHTFFSPGKYQIQLELGDGTNIVVYKKEISITGGPVEVAGWTGISYDLVLSELLPSPIGSDEEGEYIEIHNRGGETIALSGWRLEDEKGDYEFGEAGAIMPGEFLTIKREDSKLALNNDEDSVFLYFGDELVDSVEYTGPPEGESYARGSNDAWFWTFINTPGGENMIMVSESYDKPVYMPSSSRYSGVDESFQRVDLSELAYMEKGAKVSVNGLVAVEPGILGSQFFYITGSPGAQVYSYRKEFPEVVEGDYIKVEGELSFINDEPRVKIARAEDISVLEPNIGCEVESADSDSILSGPPGRLVAFEGRVLERKGANVYMDDGGEEVRVYIKKTTGIDAGIFEEEESYRVAGIVGRTSSGPRLLPRSVQDVEKLAMAPKEKNNELQAEEWSLDERSNNEVLVKYTAAIVLFIVIMAAVIYFKFPGESRKP